jgi:hypothetical protein
MAFPQTPLDLTAELLIGGTWTAITSKVYRRGEIVIARGRADESQQVERSVCAAEINNRDGRFSPRNPTGIYYGLIGRNTPMRVRKTPASEGYLLLGAAGSYASTPDSANLSITGDIDLRVDVRTGDWTPATPRVLASKWATTGNQRSWLLRLETSGVLTFFWSNNGTAENFHSSSAAPTPDATGRLAVRVTLDVDNGAAGRTMRFYTAASIDGSFTQLGTDQTSAGVTSIFDSTAAVAVGGVGTSGVLGSSSDWLGRILGMELYQGIAGTIRADVDLDDEEATGSDGSSFADGQANTWTLQGDASIVDPAVRAYGEVSEWPPRWDTTGTDIWVPIEASGVLRRLGQGASPLSSTLYRGLTTLASPPKAYWPCEDGSDATEIASGIGGPPMRISLATPTLASHTDFKCSGPLPLLNDSQWVGDVPVYTGTGNIQVWFLLHVPAAGSTANQSIVQISTTGTARRWNLVYQGAGGDLELKAYNADGDVILASGAINFNHDGDLVRVSVQLEQNGADIDWSIDTVVVGEGFATGTGGTLAGRTISRATRVQVNVGGGHTDVAIGHIAVHDAILDLGALTRELNAYGPFGLEPGEAAGRRIQRLCGDAGVAFRAVGDLDATSPMGPQLPATLIDLLREAEAADGGILHEPRDLFGLAYRTRESMYNQPAALTLDYSAADLSGIEPAEDDAFIRNDITASRVDGSSHRAILSDGPLSISDPPAGVGRYDEAVTFNVAADGQLADRAGWRLALGTVDEARYPVLKLDLSRGNFTADAVLARATEDLDIGDRLVVENPPAWLPPDDITQLAQGFKETMANFEHTVDVNCVPESPWGQVAVYDAADRYSSDGSTLNEALTTTETDVDVATPVGPVWSDADGDFDILVGGERMTVTAISGASSPQTFTVTRSVNGVVKTHASGAAVELASPAVYAI